ncbi:hypothetical protein [Phormidium tenue]|uniref:Uncharacterized protein n=1 Tax=Phormidium tenue FACHB-1050 TaxID=2692857 RepID=A0ABR8CB01_9CYAN|nr:hypothetical protein [Phormidium tenue]MBD2317844.1 hypothetical protein [Phormidium tenue FACHB-1050]
MSSLLVYKLAILIIKILFFESLPLAGFQKKDLDVSIAKGDGNIQILFKMRITAWNCCYSNPKWFVEAHPFGVRFHKPQKSTNDLGLLLFKKSLQ